MDPNNNQPISTPINTKLDQQPAGSPLQPSPVPVSAPAASPLPQQPTPASTAPSVANNTSTGGKKVTILLVILLVLVLGIVAYIIFANNQLNTTQKSAGENTSTVIPTATIAPTLAPATADEINVASPDADLKDIEADLQGL